MDDKVMELCKEANITNCVQGTQHNLLASDFKLNDFHKISYFRWDVLLAAQRYFKYVYYVDADILLLQNPWLYMHPMHFKDCDIICQVERRSLGDYNGGQMLLRNTANSQLIAQDVLSYRYSGMYDQDVFAEIFEANKAVACLLDQDRYVGHCMNPTNIRILDLVTYHATCVTDIKKQEVMTRVLMYVKAALNNTIPNDQLVYNYDKDHIDFPYCLETDYYCNASVK